MLLLYYSSQIYVKLIRKILFKFKFKKNIILKLVNNKFYFLFFKVIKISICNKTQFISVPTYKDYFISSIMKNVLEEIFEKTLNFSAFKSSYAFFDEIRHWPNVHWCLKGYFTRFFEQINLFLVGQFLFHYLHDILILNLYFRFISAGYFLKYSNLLFYQFFSKNNSFGYLLINIYLFELDRYMRNFMQNYDIIFFHIKLKQPQSLFFYIRIGFFWLVGILGSFSMVFFIKKQLLLYLCNYLSLLVFNINLQIVHLLTSSLFFLGIKIKSVEYMRSILLICPLSFLLYNFKILGFLKYFNGRLLPCAQRKWLSLSSADIFWKYYLVKVRLFKCYFFVANFSAVLMLFYFLKMSLIFTLGRKFQLTKKQICYKFKSNLLKWMS